MIMKAAIYHLPVVVRCRILPFTAFYSSRRNLSSTPKDSTTVYRGTFFEQRSLSILEKHLSMTLTRVGGKEDGGVDLIGWWWIPTVDSNVEEAVDFSAWKRVRVVAQCKAEKKKVAPKYVRELEGVVYRQMYQSSQELNTLDVVNKPTIVALFISESPFSKSALLRAMSSTVPFLLVYIPPLPTNGESDSSSGGIGTVVWNPALGGTTGLLQGRMEVRWTRSTTSGTDFPTMWYAGQLVPSLKPGV
ncbi:hypothetical protein E1B28_008321 [Marasmius oreades]|uniref:Required for respiratory growth protein 7, mitochondrial n=1 Tax=Marasmius oreades TaxID=181124 RepID=A0A9P7RY35_9AGAR|nr:uncharacterized protein E1B28_008321 [Marasmius oreades]KAG7091929.1 hypothetical protein E1B28_008321 [Marasmius oreades]